MDLTENHPSATRDPRLFGGAVMALFAAVIAAISYHDGLDLVRLAGAAGRMAYAYPLLPDGQIIISFISMYDASRRGLPRPGWATAGVALGAVLTLAMNAAAGARWIVPMALVDGLVPVVFYVAFENLVGLIRRGRGGAMAAAVPATSTPCGHGVARSADEAIRLDWEHRTGCLGEDWSQRKHAAAWGVSRTRVAALVGPPPVEPSLNGQARDE